MINYLDRSKKLLGTERIEEFSNKRIAIVGIGGVGGTAFEALLRSGFKNFLLIDADVVDETNLNRQLLFRPIDLGQPKVEVAKKYAESYGDMNIEVRHARLSAENIDILKEYNPDFIVDAIDDCAAKIEIYKLCTTNDFKFISSLGMGNRIDPEMVTIMKLNQTEGDPLARKIRYMAKEQNLDLKRVPVVFSKEQPLIIAPKPASMMMVPSTAGLLIAKYIISNI